TDGTVTTLNAPYPATGLTPSTAYEVYVRGNCGTDGFSNWIGPVNFTTFNTPPPPPVGVTCASGASTFVFTEDFGTDTNTNPSGWTGTGFDGSNGNWDITAVSGNSTGTGPNITWDGVAGGMHLEYEASGNATTIASAITPAIDLSTAVDGAELSFYMHAFGDDIGTLNVGVSTSQTGPFTTEYAWVGDYQATADEAWVPIGVNLDAYLGQVIYIEFSYGGAGTGFEGDMSIDQVSVETCGNFCVAPTGIMVDAITDTTADISWTANNGETAWEIVVQPAGTGVPTGPGTAITTNPYTAMGLSSSTVYEVYILADCGNGMSVWAGPVNFTTLNTPPPPPVGVTCASGSSTFIFTEDFGNDTNYVPSGWTGTTFADINGNWDITTPNGNSTGTGPNITWDGNPGTHLEYEGSGNTTNVASAITPAIDLSTAVDGAELSFYMHAFGDNMGTLNVGVSTSQTGPFTSEYTWIGDYQTTADEAWIPIGVNLDAYLGQVIYIEFSYVGTGDTFESDMSIDQVRVETCGNFCVAPTGLMVDAVTDTTADISWTANSGETAWEIVVQPAGTGVPTGPGTAITTNPYTAMGLNATTAYEVYILADCGNGMSVWAGPVNFITLNTPPPPPVGVTCASGGSTFIFTESFGNDTNTDPSGWTGTGFGGGNGDWDITAESANSGGTGPNITWDGNPGMHLEYEASGNATDIASAISPAIDLTPAVDGAELSFWMHAFGDDIGTLNVGVSTSPTGPFTTEFTWSGDYQSTADEAWVPIGVNLDAYLGQVIYVEFSYGGAGTGFEGDMSIDQVRVETCGSFCIAPTNLTATSITETSADISWTPSGPETQWNYVIQPAGTGVPTSGTTVSTTTVSETSLNPATDYEVYVQAICGTDTSVWAGPFNFSTLIQFNFNLDCAVDGPQTVTYCYENNDTNVFTFTSTDGTTPLNLVISAGEVENNFDEVIVLDSDGVTNLNAATPYGNAGQISGLSFQSTGTTISFQVDSDFTIGCATGGFTPITFTVTCATCINQVVDFVTVSDCDNGNNQFFVDVDITSIGDATTLNITDNQGSPMQTTTAIGIVQMGPYPLDTDVVVTVANADDSNCVVTSNTLNVPVCPPANDECTDAIIVTPNADGNCTTITSATLYGATPSSQANPCPGDTNDDVWFQFDAIATDHGIDISNIIGDTTNLDHALYEGTDCNNLTNLYCETGNNSIANGLTVGNTYYIRIFTAGDVPFQNVSFDLCVFTIPPPITTNDTLYTVPELVNNVLVNSPCAIVNNVTSSTGTDFGGPNGIGYFEANGSSFPFQSGIVLTTGNVLNAPGPETGVLSDGGGVGWPGDADLEAVINEGPTNNASIIEFEFTPLIDQLSFNFIFAAEEYGTFQCGFSDAFAFLLTDLSTGITTNIAVVPGTTDPVSVFTIRDNTHNGGCPSSNPALFDAYYGPGTGLPPITNPTNFIGRTVPLTAMAPVIPNNVYRIKLVVADDGDTAYDSAVFLEASSFDIGEIDLGDDILLDSGLATCEGESVVLDIGVPQPAGTTITWYTVANGITEPIPGETGPTLTVNTTGLYQVDIVFTGTSAACFYSDDVLVEFFDNPTADPQNTILACDTDNSGMAIFDITENEANIVGTQTDVIVIYYETEQDAIDGTNPITNPTNYISSGATTIYFRVESIITGCYKVNTFDLELAPKPVLVQADDVIGCDNDNDGIAEYDLTVNEAVISGGQSGLVFSYYNSIDDANTSTNAITGVTTYDSPGAETIYVRVENATTGCFETTTFDLVFGISPETTFDSSIVYEVCPNATVPITISAEAVNYTTSEVSIK
ncbi:choice-of-anchor L domain-containing protein, partial [Olleya aquimaris]|uniref:choice-of-anchor L domain-containing protein n=1 Tax=Olleya aquimaris TaxID=639310 RepID=UPI000DBA71D9